MFLGLHWSSISQLYYDFCLINKHVMSSLINKHAFWLANSWKVFISYSFWEDFI